MTETLLIAPMDIDMLTAEHPPKAVPSFVPAHDLSELVSSAVSRSADETVRVTRLFGNRYRANWWIRVPDGHPSSIRRSRYLEATWTSVGLQIQDLTQP